MGLLVNSNPAKIRPTSYPSSHGQPHPPAHYLLMVT